MFKISLPVTGLTALMLLWVAKFILAGALPLFGDEAFYWLESRHLAAGYDDVPPATAGLIRLGTTIGGSGVFAVRWPFLLLTALCTGLIVKIGAYFPALGHSRHLPLAAGLIASSMPLFGSLGVLALPDVPLTLAILLCAWGLLRSTQKISPPALGLLFIGLALGWLSHYRFVLAIVAGGCWLLLAPGGRALLRRRGVWISIIGGNLLGLAPLLWHNMQSDWAGFRFQFAERHPWSFHADALFDPLLQAALVTPLLYVVLMAIGVHAFRRRRQPAWSLVACMAGITLIGYGLLGPFADAERTRLHWPLPAYLLLAAAAPAVIADWPRWAKRGTVVGVLLAGAGLSTFLCYLALTAWRPDLLAHYKFYPDNFRGWREIAAAVRHQRESHLSAPEPLLAADNFMLAAELAFELGERQPVYSLDHPLNRKHGRARQLAAWGLDETGLRRVSDGRPVLLVIEAGAIKLRQQPDWFRHICESFPDLRWQFERSLDHGRKRFIVYASGAGDSIDNICVPPAMGYLALLPDIQTGSAVEVTGWAFRDRRGIDRLSLELDGKPIAVPEYGLPMPGVRELWPASDDPRQPDVGFRSKVVVAPFLGWHWLKLNAHFSGGAQATLLEAPVRLSTD